MRDKMPGSMVLINTEAGEIVNVIDDLKGVDSVEEAEAITGQYDVVAIVRSDTPPEMSKVLIEDVRNIEGVEDTVTHNFISLEKVR